jgi:Domain of unknown function (DUF6487)
MSETTFETCPRCGKMIEAGFTGATAPGLSFVAPDKFRHFAFLDEDVSKAGIRKFLPWAARYFRSYLCRSCELYIVEYSVRLNRAQANQAAAAMTSAN